jgi:dihydrofolate reductase
MAQLISFMQVSIDGCFADETGDMSWAHRDDAEAQAFMTENATGGGMLLFGRVTYELMTRYWPTPAAAQNAPVAAASINRMPKVVFSRTLKRATWENSRVVQGDLVREVKKLKAEGTLDMAIMGSGSIVAALARENLIDAYQIMIVPIVLGAGKRFLEGVDSRPRLTLDKTRTFKNGNVFVTYRGG